MPHLERRGRASLWICTREAVAHFIRDGEGKISFLAIPWVLGMLILLGLIGNTGQAVIEKGQVQNAADAAAFSTALWQARGMNAVTTTNHMMGEISALVVLHEALGGPELDKYYMQDSDTIKNLETNKSLSDSIDSLCNFPTHLGPPYDFEIVPLSIFDGQLVPQVQTRFNDDDQYSGATIYDARMTLKNGVVLALSLKAILNRVQTVLMIIPPLEYLANVITVPVHIVLDFALVEVTKEWVVLTGLEHVAGITKEFKTLARTQLLPLLSQYGDFVAGQMENKPVNRAIDQTLAGLKSSHGVQLEIFPASKDLVLPVFAEPESYGQEGGSSGRPPSEWKGQLEQGGVLNIIRDQVNFIDDKILGRARSIVDAFTSWNIGIVFPDWNIPSLKEEIEKLAGVELLDDPPESLQEGTEPGWKDNASIEGLPEFDWQAERRTQWVRATYPYVDSFRGAVLAQFQDSNLFSFGLKSSRAAYYYVHWTNRYTLAESHRMRTGEYPPAAGDAGVPHMQVMLDSLPENRGQEGWTSDNARAEQMFTVMAFAYRTLPAPKFFPQVFVGKGVPITTYSLAMTYNANGRVLNDQSQAQPNTGWNTLNWQPPVQAPEWGGREPTMGSKGDFLDLFRGSSIASGRAAQVRLNWQAKLVPVTATRFSAAVADSRITTPAQRTAEQLNAVFRLNTH